MRLLALALTLALTVALAGACGGNPTAPAAAPAAAPVPVVVEVASPGSLGRGVDAIGVIAARESVEIRPETSGVIQATSFEDGDVVKRGAVLARLRDADQKANRLDAGAREQLAKLELDRARALFERGDTSKASLESAEASWTLSKAALNRADEALRRTVITAPFDGVLGVRMISVGETVDTGRVVTRLDAIDQLVVDLSVPESLVARLAMGQAAEVRAEVLGGSPLTGAVSYVAPRVRDDTRTLDLRVSLPQDDRLRPGMGVTVRVVTDTVEGALKVPTQAVVPTGTGAALWIMGEDSTASLRPVATGAREADRVEIISGLNAGERVIIEGLSRLRPGAAVAEKGAEKPAQAPAPAGGAAH